MHQSRTAAESACLAGKTDEPDTQQCYAMFEQAFIASDPVDAGDVGDNNDQDNATDQQLSAASVVGGASLLALPSTTTSDLNASSTADNVSWRDEEKLDILCDFPPLSSGINILQQGILQSTDNEARKLVATPNVTSSALPSLKSTYGRRKRLVNAQSSKKWDASAKMQGSQNAPHGSYGSTLSTTQEFTPNVYRNLEESIAQDQFDLVQNETLNENDIGFIDLEYEVTSPLQYSTVAYSERPVDMQLRDVDTDKLSPTTPGPSRPQFLEKSNSVVMDQSQLFAMTQASPAMGFTPRVPIPSSSRPSPNIYDNSKVASGDVSSPLVGRHATQAHEDKGREHLSSSPDFQLRGDESEAEDPSSVEPKVIGCPASSSRHTTRRIAEPRNTYISIRDSQERKKRRSVSRFQDSDDSDFHDEEAERRQRAKHIRKKAANAFAIPAKSGHPSSGEIDVVEVPSTAKKPSKRTQSQEYIAQCNGIELRDSQTATIADSQTKLQSLEPQSQIPNNIEVLHESTLSNDNHMSQPHVGTHVLHDVHQDRNHLDGHPTLSRDLSLSTGSEASTERLPSQQLQATSTRTEFQTPAPQRSSAPTNDDVVLETSPMAPGTKTFAQIELEYPENGDAPPSSFKLTQDDIDREIFPNSPLQLKMLRSEAAFVAPKLPVIGSANKAVVPVQRTLATTLPSSASSALSSLDGSFLTDPATSSPTTTTDVSVVDAVAGEGHRINDIVMATIPSGIVDSTPKTKTTETAHEAATSTRVLRTSDQLKGPSSGLRRAVDPADGLVGLHANETEAIDDLDLDAGIHRSVTKQDSGANPNNNASKSGSSKIVSSRQAKRKKTYGKSRASPRTAGATSNLTQANTTVDINNEEASSKPQSLAALVSSRTLRALAKGDIRDVSTPHMTPNGSRGPTRSSKRVAASEKPRSEEFNVPITPSRLGRISNVTSREPSHGLFQDMAFCVSYINRADEKHKILKHIHELGGLVLENGFDELFDLSSSALTTPSSVRTAGRDDSSGVFDQLTLKPEAIGLKFTCLIADDYSRRTKYMQALALGLPCISGLWVSHCVAKKQIIPWDAYMLAAGKSDFLGGAIRSRTLQPYPAESAIIRRNLDARPKILQGKRVLLVMAKGKAEQIKKPYCFLIQALGVSCVKRVLSNEEARKVLVESQGTDEAWDWVYVDYDKRSGKKEAVETIFGSVGRKRKRGSSSAADIADDAPEGPDPKKIRLDLKEYQNPDEMYRHLLDMEW